VTDRPPHRPRRRDRRGRGLRGPLLPAGLPAARSRAAQFDDLVLDAVDRVSRRWGAELHDVEVAVEDVPPAGAEGVSLSRAEPATADRPARIVVHRRPVESRATGLQAREDLVHDAVVEAVADLLGMSPDVVDPERDDDGPD
jgi:predicted Zn-dependent protease with MMP-like domain